MSAFRCHAEPRDKRGSNAALIYGFFPMMNQIAALTSTLADILAITFTLSIVCGGIAIVVLYIIDSTQKQSTLRRNYPVIARFRYLFEHMGEFFRQYFFALDRDEMPFNRAERSWCYRAAKGLDNTIPFGSTRNLQDSGTVFFVNTAFPVLDQDAAESQDIIFGHSVGYPFITRSYFNISGMSYGALSIPAVESLSKGAKAAKIWLNTGEGGLSPYHLSGGCDIVFQIGTAKFGVRKQEGGFDESKLLEVASHSQVRMFEIKVSQGAKPGKGGILPGVKVTEEIAKIRGIHVGESAISPNRHPEVFDVGSLLDMVDYIRKITQKPVGFKTVVGAFDWIEDLCIEVHKRGIASAPDFITIDSGDGGTGAAPMSLMDCVGMRLRESLPGVIDVLHKYDLRSRIRIGGSGKLINPSEVAWALCAGADYTVSARGFMFALGCIQALQCNKNTCPTGITTHNPKLQHGIDVDDKAQRVRNYAENMMKEVNVIAHSCGVSQPHDFQRHHARIVTSNGDSVPLSILYPSVKPDPHYATPKA